MGSNDNSRPNTLECGPVTVNETDHRNTGSNRLDDEVIGLKESARIVNISLATLRRQIEAGEGGRQLFTCRRGELVHAGAC
jgi:hypothetical protein